MQDAKDVELSALSASPSEQRTREGVGGGRMRQPSSTQYLAVAVGIGPWSSTTTRSRKVDATHVPPQGPTRGQMTGPQGVAKFSSLPSSLDSRTRAQGSPGPRQDAPSIVMCNRSLPGVSVGGRARGRRLEKRKKRGRKNSALPSQRLFPPARSLQCAGVGAEALAARSALVAYRDIAPVSRRMSAARRARRGHPRRPPIRGT